MFSGRKRYGLVFVSTHNEKDEDYPRLFLFLAYSL